MTLHIEEALKRKHAEVINFSDMGHSHFFIPQKFYDDEIAHLSSSETHILYEKILSHRELKILYHTAEMINLKSEDRHLRWRFFTRNVLGDNKELGKLELLHDHESRSNASSDYDPGYRYWGGGYNISANARGCLSYEYQGKTFYFDLSLQDIHPQTISND